MKPKQQIQNIPQIMVCKQNPLTGNWLCHIPNTSQAYYCERKTDATKFCTKVNIGFFRGEISLINGIVTINKKNASIV